MSFTIDEMPRSGNFDQKASYFYTRKFLVVSTETNNSWVTVANAVMFDLSIATWDTYYDGETTDDNAYLKAVKAEQQWNKYDWHVTLEYDSSVGPHREMTYAWDSISRQEVVTVDLTNEPATNTAGDPFNPPLTRNVTRPVVTIKFWGEDAHYEKILEYKDAVNEAEWDSPWGDTYPANTVKCIAYKIHSPSDFQVVMFFEYEIQLEITTEADPFNPTKVLNSGVRYKPAIDVISVLEGALVRNFPIVDQNTGAFVSSPVPLTVAGLPLAPGDPLVYVSMYLHNIADFDAIFP